VAELLPQLVGAGGFGALAVIIVVLLSSNRTDRKTATELIAAANQRARDAFEREDAARAAQRAAEDTAADLAREVKALRERVESLTAEVERLRGAIGNVP